MLYFSFYFNDWKLNIHESESHQGILLSIPWAEQQTLNFIYLHHPYRGINHSNLLLAKINNDSKHLIDSSQLVGI